MSVSQIYVGNLHKDATEQELREAFSTYGEIANVNVSRERLSGISKGYAFIYFVSDEGVVKALAEQIHPTVHGQQVNVVRVDDDSVLFVGNLDIGLSEERVLAEIQSLVGPILHLELKTGPPPTFVSRGFAFILFSTREKTEAAFAKLSDSVISGRRLRVDYAQNKGKADPGVLARSTQLYVANVNLCVNEQVLTAYFSQFGKVRHCMIVRQAGGTSKGFAFVEFDSRSDMELALKYANNQVFCGQAQSITIAKPREDYRAEKARDHSMRGGGRGTIRGNMNYFGDRGGFQQGGYGGGYQQGGYQQQGGFGARGGFQSRGNFGGDRGGFAGGRGGFGDDRNASPPTQQPNLGSFLPNPNDQAAVMKAAADLVAQNPALVHAALALAQQQGVVAPVASAPPTASLSDVQPNQH